MSLNIALIGYGRMGKAVEKEALQRGHQVLCRIDKNSEDAWETLAGLPVDVAIDFTHPETALDIFRKVLSMRIPLVTGTTGWQEQLTQVTQWVEEGNGAFLYSSNFSVGVNLLFKLNQTLTRLMNPYPEYDAFIEEAHHRHKKDAPSGTAISLADQVLEGLDRKNKWVREELKDRPPLPEELSVAASRAGEIIGRHTVTFISEIDQLKISHEAFNRRGFALGSVIAAEWLSQKKGFYNFADIFE